MNTYLEKIARSFTNTANKDWQKIRLFLETIETGGICSRLTTFVLYPGKEPESIIPDDEYDEQGDILSTDYMDDLHVLWESQEDQSKKWYCATITIWPDGQVDFEPTSYTEPSFEDEYTIDGIVT